MSNLIDSNNTESNLTESNLTDSNLKNEVFRTFYKKTKTYLNKDSNCWKSAKMRLGRRTTRRTVVVTTDRRELCRPILGAISSAAFFIPLDGKCDGPS